MPPANNKIPKIFIDLFSGVGGFHIALKSLGCNLVFACEIDESARAVYISSYKLKKSVSFEKNIRSITRNTTSSNSSFLNVKEINNRIPTHDILCGGFPCPTYSKSGKQMGTSDRKRGTLYLDILKIIKSKRPKYIMLENVKNIVGPKHIKTYKKILKELDKYQYLTSKKILIFSPHLLPQKEGGTPQTRERVFILGIRNPSKRDKESIKKLEMLSENMQNRAIMTIVGSKKITWSPDLWNFKNFIRKTKKITSKELGELRISNEENNYINAWEDFVSRFPAKSTLPGFPLWEYVWKDKLIIPSNTPEWKINFLRKNYHFYLSNKKYIDAWRGKSWGGKYIHDFPMSRRKFEWQANRHLFKSRRTLKELILQLRPSGIRVKPPTYLPALVAINQTTILGPRISGTKYFRRISVREAASLQGLDQVDFSIVPSNKAYKQIGNAVCAPLVRKIAGLLMGFN